MKAGRVLSSARRAARQRRAVVGLAHRNGLDDAQLPDRIGQLVQRLLVELRARLRGVGDDVGNVDFGHPAHGFEFGIEVDGVAAEDGIQPATEPFRLFHVAVYLLRFRNSRARFR